MIKVDSYTKDIAAAATAENLVADSGTQWKFAKEVIIEAPSTNTSDLLVGSRDRQALSLSSTGEKLVLSTIINRMSQSEKFDLRDIFVKAGTDGDDVNILLIDPSES